MSRNSKPCSQISRSETTTKQITAGKGTISSTTNKCEPVASKPQKKTSTPKPTLLQKRVFKEALNKSVASPRKIVKSTDAAICKIRPPYIETDKGREKVLQQIVTERTVQRSPKAELITESIRGVDTDECGGVTQVEIASHRIDPTHATESSGVNETISVTSSLSITPSGKHKRKSITKRTILDEECVGRINLNPHNINRLVKEETEDVVTTLMMVPPDLIDSSFEKYPLKKKLQALRISSGPISILEQSICRPSPTADEVDNEAPPEVLATIIHAVERGASPQSAPQQMFNTLFPEIKEEIINVSSVVPGPLEDIMVPTTPAKEPTVEVLNEEMEKLVIDKVQNAMELLPTDDICTEKQIAPPTRTSKAQNKTPISVPEEVPPWGNEDITNISPLVGGDPFFSVELTDTSALQTPQEFSNELSKGIEFILDANTAPFENRFQLRGTKMPNWWPGYMAVFPHLPDMIEIKKKPSGVLQTAWRAVQPKLFPEDSVIIY